MSETVNATVSTAISPRTEPLLELDRLSVRFLLGRRRGGGEVRAVTDASLALRPGRVLALVGESGCGKSVLASALLGLLPANAQVRGRALLHRDRTVESGGSVELLTAPESVLARRVRGRLVGLVPQSAGTHLTPVRTARAQLEETIRRLRPRADPASADELADWAGLRPEQLDHHPHELSGGMAQRVAMALALAGDPPVVLADEPTTGLDRPLVDRTVDQLGDIAGQGRAVLLITHDLAAARRVATDVAVMYASRIVEAGPTAEVFGEPWHPYTAGLLRALPEGGFEPIPGHPPSLTELEGLERKWGCVFCQRCPEMPGFAPCTGDPEPIDHGDRRVAAHPPC
ncbi:peptide/nickel transport system ATP-binding protein [Halopolyspora algeriensis]|uniref:Nickel import system ATP-binding protein NikD n=1 Tax=Halopolyspora algeriensis TaxID=1500506 RepID=A0A368VNE8_9ACTN|nr:ABC transporter ATP-binding protein [Halopolyspora algeriensis]RCW43241.1 peptide/nickel transport system ATP-binding protein [Halopolyspora algeriensis]TQM56300.1 peptide/nickel transport system ATP-binding protein [Halopolyspora algeriensis]